MTAVRVLCFGMISLSLCSVLCVLRIGNACLTQNRTVGEGNSKIPQRDAIRLFTMACKVPASVVAQIDDVKKKHIPLALLGIGSVT
eukprot:6686090-Lingulodinium_polyedra.AAC.1